MATIDNVLKRLKYKIYKLDHEIRDLVRQQTDAGSTSQKELEEIKQSILGLYNRIRAIKEKAQSSEQMVHDITRDIKSLDHAKKNLTLSMTVLKRLQMMGM